MNQNLLCMAAFIFTSSALFGQSAIVGHRGASYLAPENTIASLELAWTLGAPSTECDIMMTSDNQVIVFHDKNGKRLLGKDIEIKNTTYDHIRNLKIILPKKSNDKKYEGQTIPLLSDVLSRIPADKELIIEIKTDPSIIPFLSAVVKHHHAQGKIAFIAFDIETIILAKKTFPKTPCYFLASNKEDLKRSLPQVLEHSLDGVNLKQEIIDRSLVSELHAMELDIWCWTVNTPHRAKALIDMGVSCVTSDRPAWLAAQLKK